MGQTRQDLLAARRARRDAALAARPGMTPTRPAPDRLRLATWNLNSLRLRADALIRFVDLVQPDVLCLQETKVSEPAPAVVSALAGRGYRLVHTGRGGYNGVAIAARHEITDVRVAGQFGVEVLDREPRLVTGVVATPEPLQVASVYVPHGRTVGHWHYEYKLAYLRAIAGLVTEWLAGGHHVVLAGDVNVAVTDSDVFHPDAFVGSTHVTPAERAALAEMYDAGLVDVDVARWGPRARRFTWWNHGIGYSRNLGMRLDHIAVDRGLAARLETTWIDHGERERPGSSDHAALVADVRLAGHPEPEGGE